MVSTLHEVQSMLGTELGPLYTLCAAVSMTSLEIGAVISPAFPDEEAEVKPVADSLASPASEVEAPCLSLLL